MRDFRIWVLPVWALLAVGTVVWADETTTPTIEITLDVSAAPEHREWLERSREMCLAYWPRLVRDLATEGHTPPTQAELVVTDLPGVAHTQGRRITVSSRWIASRPRDFGCVIHELAHVAQQYPPRGAPSWLVEAQADYYRWFDWEPKEKRPRASQRTATYKSPYQVGGQFMEWVFEKHGAEINRKIAAAARARKYDDALWKEWTGQSLRELWDAWSETLPGRRRSDTSKSSWYLPVSDYIRQEIPGWDVRIEKRILERHPEMAETLREDIVGHLEKFETLFPKKVVEELRKVTVWVSFDAAPAACYHPSVKWLEENGRNPAMARCVEITNARNYLKWSDHQPAILLHEMAHAYHHRVFGWNERRILNAFLKARREGMYENVRHANGAFKRHYALTDHKEYFSELSEAYFARNDFQPFDREELREFDPRGYKVVEQIWGVGPDSTDTAGASAP